MALPEDRPMRLDPRSDAHPLQGQEAEDTLADLGEWELIRRLGAFAPAGQFADDAALLGDRQEGQGALVVNTDVLVEGIHFSDATTRAADVGWRAAAANFSDLAAMGATEVVGLTVGLVAPSGTAWPWVEGVYEGISEALRVHGGVLLGGDCSSGTQRLLAITAIGRLPAAPAAARTLPADESPRTTHGSGPWGAIRRSDGRPGDLLVCTGPHGLSRLGLALLQGELASGRNGGKSAAARGRSPGDRHAVDGPNSSATAAEQTRKTPAAGGVQASPGDAAAPQAFPGAATEGRDGCAGKAPDQAALPHLGPELVQRAIRSHQRPRPRFDAVRALIDSRPQQSPWRVAGCDSSDGLAAAAKAIALTSGCAARLDREALPLDPAMATLAQAQAWCLGGGEDFELVLALPRTWAEALLQALPGSSVIGRLQSGDAGSLGWTEGEAWLGDAPQGEGYQHFH